MSPTLSEKSMDKSTLSVLLVDDDPYTCELFKLIFEFNQLPLHIATNSEEAIDYLQTNSPDVVVLDLFLPGTDGYHTLDSIRQLTPNGDVKVVAFTAYYTQETPEDVHKRGFDGYIAKPFEPTELVNTLLTFIT